MPLRLAAKFGAPTVSPGEIADRFTGDDLPTVVAGLDVLRPVSAAIASAVMEI